MSAMFKLPENADTAAALVCKLVESGETLRNPSMVRWLITMWYMKGVRHFDSINYKDGSVLVGFYNSEGEFEFTYEEILTKYQTQFGRLLSMDLRPYVERKGISLDGLRKASTAQLCLDAVMTDKKVASLKFNAISGLLHFGTIGECPRVSDTEKPSIEVVMPWELLPLPIDLTNPFDYYGVMRVRHVPIEWLKDLPNMPSSKSKIWKEMDVIEVESGVAVDQDGTVTNVSGGTFFSKSGDKTINKEQPIQVAKFIELWSRNADDYQDMYAMYAGGKELYRKDTSNDKIPFPVKIARDITVEGFYGRSYLETLLPLNHEMENAVAKFFRSLQDWNQYGLLMEPTTSGLPREILPGSDGIQRARYEPDPLDPGIKPFNIAPSTTVTFPLKAMEVASGLLNKMANQPTELLSGDAPGRTDSSAALGTLHQLSNVPLSPTAESIAMATSGVYEYILKWVADNWDSDTLVNITRMDDSLAGIRLDKESGRAVLDPMLIPHPSEVDIKTMAILPKSSAQKKMELDEALKLGTLTLIDYYIQARTMGLDIPVGGELEYQNYRTAMYNNIMLWGDGETPGKVVVTEEYLVHIHLMVLDNFMARPEFQAARPAVITAFRQLRGQLVSQIANMPDNMEYLEETAEEEMANIAQLQNSNSVVGGQPQLPM